MLIVPATPVRDLFFRQASGEKAEAVARKHVEKGRTCFEKEGVSLADARVGGAEPIDAIEQELRGDPDYSAVVLSTLPGENSRWLKMGLPQTVESRFGVPVIHVEAPAAWTYGP